MKIKFVLGLLSIASLFTGCKTIVVDDLKVWEKSWIDAQAELRRRAAFEMPCTASDIQMTLIETNRSNIQPWPWAIGATGCGKRLTYRIAYGSGWVLDSRTELDAASAAPAKSKM